MNRRDLIKMLAAGTAALSFGESLSATGTNYGCDSNTANDAFVHFIFHGLFFMQFINGGLVAATPPLTKACPKHELVGGELGHLTNFTGDLKFSAGLVPGSPVNDFKKYPSIAQFSLQETGVTPVFTKARATVTLPYPSQVIPLRPGSLNELFMCPGNVQKSLAKACGQGGNASLAIGVCFRYQSSTPGPIVPGSGPLTIHLFAEPNDGSHTYKEMNCVYADSGLTAMLKNFDLQLSKDPAQISIPTQDQCPLGISTQDELSLFEINMLPAKRQEQAKHRRQKRATPENVNVANCIPYGLNP